MLLRSTLLYLARHKALRRWMETSPWSNRLTSRFVAGPVLDDAVEVCERLGREGLYITLDHLGESVTSLEEAEASRNAYLDAMARIAGRSFESSVSVKLTQFGLDLLDSACRSNIERLVSEAARLGKRVEIDMESSEYVDRTLRIAWAMHEQYRNVRAVIQAYLYRSEKDIEEMCAIGLPVRLCKGAYKEPATVAFRKKSDVDANYVHLMKILLERGSDPGLATHDEAIIEEARRFVREHAIPPDRYEFQMLYGIRRDVAHRLVKEGEHVRLYVPYGAAWYPYFMRRLAERPANLLFLMRNLLRG